ncbi:MAG: hypothetical protein HYT07_01305 [Candidatus Levybacteria bacterium]|nr:hypothetical protein [Candidatus Levybacteria bacterium]
MKGIATCQNCIIELWKNDCEHCEAVKPIVAELEKEGYVFEKHNIEEKDGETLWHEYAEEIEKNNKSMGYDEGYIYTPTFINPDNRNIIAFTDREPTKTELIRFAEGGEPK